MARRPLKSTRVAARRAPDARADVDPQRDPGAARPRAAAPRATEAPTRVPVLDALRGVAIIAMVIYHFCFDLRHFGLTRSDFEHDPFWLAARGVILSSFMLIAGISMVLARRAPGAEAQWLRRVAVIGAAALAVSVASWLMFPQSFIWFGVLHAIAAALLLARPLVDRPALAAIVGVVVIVAGLSYLNVAFDNRALGWIGFMTHKPATEDYVPLAPWAGVLFVGIAAGHGLVKTRFALLAPLARAPTALRAIGRHSLAIYLVHQPLMIGLLWLALRWR